MRFSHVGDAQPKPKIGGSEGETRSVTAETLGFPFAAQAAQLTRQRPGRQDETVCVLTDLRPAEIAPRQWLQANRQGWWIETGSHQRLAVSLNDDLCRVRSPNGLWILGMLRRLVISLFMEWRGRQPKPHHKHFPDFQAAMGEDNLTKALGFVTQQRRIL